MSRSDVSICAGALVLLGASPISSFDDDDDNARVLKIMYPEIRGSIIASYQWECMRVRKALTRMSAKPIGYAYQFLFPGEAIGAPIGVFPSADAKGGISDFEVFGRTIATDRPEIWADFTVEKPENEWPAWMAELVRAAVCAAIAFQVTDQNGVAERWEMKAFGTPQEGGFGGLMGKAMTLDAQGSGNIGLVDTAFTDARFGVSFPGEEF